jgi:hypothetical protein
VSAACRLSPTPPALVERRNTATPAEEEEEAEAEEEGNGVDEEEEKEGNGVDVDVDVDALKSEICRSRRSRWVPPSSRQLAIPLDWRKPSRMSRVVVS